MAYDICNVCERFFTKDGNESCPDCREKDRADFEKLRNLIKYNPGMMVFEASNQTGIPVNTIMRFVKERRIYISSDTKDTGKIYFRDTLPENSTKKGW